MTLKPIDLRDPAARTKMATVDIALNFFLFTPLLVLHYECTTIIVDYLFLSWFPWFGAVLLLAIGMGGQFLLTFYQNRIPALIPEHIRGDKMYLLIIARLYTLLLVTINICHITAITFFFTNITGGAWTSTIKACTTSTLALWAFKAGRNTVCAPLYLTIDHDTDVDNFHEFSTVFRSQQKESQESLVDSLVTTIVVYSFIHLHWAAVSGVQDILFIPSLPFISMIISLAFGVAGCALLIFFQHPACDLSKDIEKENDVKRIVFEDMFMLAASVAVITYWRGVGLCFDFFMGIFPLYWRGFDVTALVGWIMSYLMLTLVHLTNSLPFKGCELDGELNEGQGCLFTTAYFLELLADDKKQQQQQQQKDSNVVIIPSDKISEIENVETLIPTPSGEQQGIKQRHLLNNGAPEATPVKEKTKTPETAEDHLKQA